MRGAALILLLAATAACSGNDSPTAPTSTASQQTELFSGVLPRGGSRFYAFTVTDPAYVTAMLASVTAGGPALGTPLGLAFGTPAGTDCAMAESITASPALTAQLSAYKGKGIHCVRVYDIGQLAADVSFAVRLVHY